MKGIQKKKFKAINRVIRMSILDSKQVAYID